MKLGNNSQMLTPMRALLAVVFIFLLDSLLCTSAQNLWGSQKINGVIDIETEEVNDYMTFSGSKLTPIIRASISYWQEDPNDPQSPEAIKTKYEDLWYRAGDPLACTVYHALGLREGSITQINLHSKVKSKSNNAPQHISDAEIKAGANALVRIYFDATFIHALPTTIIVPGETFVQLTDVLANENFFDRSLATNKNLDPSLMLPLVTDDGFASAFLCYGNPIQ
jgi:hypothetical protein